MPIIVSTDVGGESVDVGDILFVAGNQGMHRARFTYDADWIAAGYPIEPGLRLGGGAHELAGLPLAVEDAAPDSWGETLLQRAERHRAEAENRGSARLTPDAFLLGATDATRQGALRFRTEQGGPYLGEEASVPKMLDMEVLLSDASEVSADPNTLNWDAVRRLLETGSSALGGARPKAAVRDDHGDLWLAKFPKPDDGNDVPVWEMVALDIAERADLTVPERQLRTVVGCHVLLVKRFDRDGTGGRIPYISARTLLAERNPAVARDYDAKGGIAQRLRGESPDPNRDLPLLWRQAVLNLLVNNTDNHLRNHGFLRQGPGWTLAPVFDLDPNPDTGTQFNTHFAGAVQRGTGLRAMLENARDFALTDAEAKNALDHVWNAVSGWDEAADGYGARDTEIHLFRPAFEGLADDVERLLSTKR